MQILQQPQNYTGRLGDTASFTVVVEGSGITYNWQFSSNGGSTWKASSLTGKTTATASGEITTERLNYLYRCAISDGTETIYSAPVAMILFVYVLGSATITLSTVVDVAATYRYYLLQSSTLNPPTKPTVNPPTGNWTDTEPTYTSGSTNTLYFVDLTVFSDGTWSYSSVSRSSAYEAAKEAYNRAVAAQEAAARALSQTELIIGTQTAATGAWTGIASFSELVDGQQIAYWLPYAGSGNATLNLTLSNGSTTGAVNCYYSGTTRLTTHYAAGNVVHLTYRKNAVISGGSTTYTGWWADANYDTNTYDRVRLNNAITAKTAISSAHLIVGDNSGFFHLTASAVFDINKPILYAASAISVAATGTGNYLSYPSINLRTTNGVSSWTAEKGKTCYLVGTLTGSTFTVAATNWLTTAPADETGTLSFISLGFMYSTYQLYLYPEHPIFRIIGGVLTAASQIAYEAQAAVVELEDNMELQLENVHAQITETADSIRQEVQANYASSAGVDQLRQQVTSLSEQTEDNFTWSVTRINQLQSDLTDGQEATDEQLALIRTYMSFTEAGLIIGKTGNPFTFRVVNNKLSFYMNETEVAYLSNNKLYVTQAEILTRLQIGKFAYEPQTNGNLSLIYTG